MTQEKINRQMELCKLYTKTASMTESENIVKEFESLYDDNQRLAILLHNILCREDHNYSECLFYDECDGLYHDWKGRFHQKYLNLADDLINRSELSVANVESVLSIVSQYDSHL